MTTTDRSLLLGMIWLAGAAGACTNATVRPIETSVIKTLDAGDIDSRDPYACQVEIVPLAATASGGGALSSFAQDSSGYYVGVCRRTGTGCWLTTDLSCNGGRCGGFTYDPATNDLVGGQHMVCAYSCNVDSDCPQPASGTAVATCVSPAGTYPGGGSCAIGCGAGETCPDGFICAQPGLSFTSASGALVPYPKSCLQYEALSIPRDLMAP